MTPAKRPPLPVIQLREWRMRQGFTQARLAEATGITITNLSRLENQHYGPEASTLRKIAEAMGIEPHQLYTIPEDMAAAIAGTPMVRPVREGKSSRSDQ